MVCVVRYLIACHSGFWMRHDWLPDRHVIARLRPLLETYRRDGKHPFTRRFISQTNDPSFMLNQKCIRLKATFMDFTEWLLTQSTLSDNRLAGQDPCNRN